MLTADRFLVSKSVNPCTWLGFHSTTVSATTVAKASTEAGFAQVVAEWGQTVEPNPYMTFGATWEPFIIEEAKHRFGVMPCDWIVRSAESPLYTASPDGLTLDLREGGEAKTGGKPWKSPPVVYRRQCQWQMFVCDLERVHLGLLLRGEDFQPAVLEPDWFVVERDEKEIQKLRAVADRLIEELELA